MTENDFDIEEIELFPIQEAYLAQVEAEVANALSQAVPGAAPGVAADLQASHGINIHATNSGATQEATAADIINTGLYANPYIPLHVSPSMAEQQTSEADLIQYMGEELLAEINNYGAPVQSYSQAAQTILAPTFEIASNPTVSIAEIKARRFAINDDGKYVKETDYLFDNIENRFNLMDFS